jgi:preprotein translocase subunit SecD
MYKNLKWKIPLILLVIAGAVALALPLKDKIVLGLDLQGGMHLVLEVEAEKAVEATLERMADDIKRSLDEGDVEVDQVFDRKENHEVHVILVDTIDTPEMEEVLTNHPNLEKKEVLRDGLETVYRLNNKEIDWIKENAVQQGLETIRNRIDEFGVSEPTIQIQGKRRILVQLPGIKDFKRAIDLIGKTARLEFKLVDETMSVDAAMNTTVPEGDEILYQKTTDKETGKVTKEPYLIKKRAVLTGDTLTAAEVRYDNQYNEPYVAINFNSDGARIFHQVTRDNIQKRLAIVLDGNIYSAPVIQDAIAGGSAQITGRFSTEEARDLAIILRAGALPAPVTILENRTVGPSLGRDSIEKGIKSILIGALLVVIFILIYYRLSGVIAVTALIVNIVLLMGALAYFGASLTLPGIAGIILTVGMAIDANVLVFERIREEIKVGKTVRAAIDAGFAKALRTIVDANVTTFIAAFVLFQFGTGPIKGFAITLCIGIAASMFTAIFMSRTIFDLIMKSKKIERLSI